MTTKMIMTMIMIEVPVNYFKVVVFHQFCLIVQLF